MRQDLSEAVGTFLVTSTARPTDRRSVPVRNAGPPLGDDLSHPAGSEPQVIDMRISLNSESLPTIYYFIFSQPIVPEDKNSSNSKCYGAGRKSNDYALIYHQLQARLVRRGGYNINCVLAVFHAPLFDLEAKMKSGFKTRIRLSPPQAVFLFQFELLTEKKHQLPPVIGKPNTLSPRLQSSPSVQEHKGSSRTNYSNPYVTVQDHARHKLV
ncbi:hypothetical protein K435DRAFT_800329 [Dendrothele bispora CBS 962.96]|uniref:Uncharacterized protein n=1 Tax=Dendrothele bispora (strain CBS 962.96) TaxID=1314807 RepID=A0A4S8LU56_DENBC|nr:hypothetical protein K435DRAFT_800329 [Dendrothele bispora CBS 962.96]